MSDEVKNESMRLALTSEGRAVPLTLEERKQAQSRFREAMANLKALVEAEKPREATP